MEVLGSGEPQIWTGACQGIGRDAGYENLLWTSQGTGKVVGRDPLKLNQETIRISDIQTVQDLQNYYQVQPFLEGWRISFSWGINIKAESPGIPPTCVYCLYTFKVFSLSPCPLSTPASFVSSFGKFSWASLTLASWFCLSDTEDLGASAACNSVPLHTYPLSWWLR